MFWVFADPTGQGRDVVQHGQRESVIAQYRAMRRYMAMLIGKIQRNRWVRRCGQIYFSALVCLGLGVRFAGLTHFDICSALSRVFEAEVTGYATQPSTTHF